MDLVKTVETDLLPEYCHYRDEGCEISGSCLNCPLPRCLYEEPGGKQRWLKKQRNREIARLHCEGKVVRELAQIFKVSRRTVQRVIKEQSTLNSKSERNKEEANAG